MSNASMLLRTAVLLAIALVCVACTEDRGPLPAVPTPEEAAAAAAQAEADVDWRVTVDGFLDAIRPLVGEAPVECGREIRQKRLLRAGDAPPELVQAWFDCTRTAAAAGKASFVVLSHPTIDSWVVGGTLVSGDGRAFAFVYDTMLGDRGRLMLGPCASPTRRAVGTGLYGVRCANERRNGTVPMSEQPQWFRGTPPTS